MLFKKWHFWRRLKMKIQDGTGTGNKLKVDNKNRAHTRAVTTDIQLDAARIGDSYQIGSGVLTLTNTTETPLIYFKNNEDEDVILTGINITSNKMTNSSCCVFLAKIYLESTGIACGTTQEALNNNFGSSQTLCADVTAGGTGSTLTGGTASGAFYIPVNTFFNTDISWVIPKGTTIAITATPASGNTSFPITVTIEGAIIEDE